MLLTGQQPHAARSPACAVPRHCMVTTPSSKQQACSQADLSCAVPVQVMLRGAETVVVPTATVSSIIQDHNLR